jgi:hypothetical protein
MAGAFLGGAILPDGCRHMDLMRIGFYKNPSGASIIDQWSN